MVPRHVVPRHVVPPGREISEEEYLAVIDFVLYLTKLQRTEATMSNSIIDYQKLPSFYSASA